MNTCGPGSTGMDTPEKPFQNQGREAEISQATTDDPGQAMWILP